MDLILSSFLSVDVFTCLMLQLLPAWTLHHDSMIQHATSQANTKTSLKHSEINTQQLSGCYHSHPFFLPPKLFSNLNLSSFFLLKKPPRTLGGGLSHGVAKSTWASVDSPKKIHDARRMDF